MPQHTNEPQPFLLEIHGLKPLTFGGEAEAAGYQAAPDALKTQPDEIGPLPPIRTVAEVQEIDVWEHAVSLGRENSIETLSELDEGVDEDFDDLI